MAEAAAVISAPGMESTNPIKRTLSNPINFTLFLGIILLTIHVVYIMRRKGKTFGQAMAEEGKLLASPTAVVAILGFITGLGEAIIFQNVKVHGIKGGTKLFTMPNKKELGETVTVLIVTSILTGLLTDMTLRMLPKDEPIQASKK